MHWRSYSAILISAKFWISVLASLGGLWTVIEATNFFQDSWSPHIREYWWAFLIGGISIGLIRAWPKFQVIERISKTDTDVKVVIGSVFMGNNPILVAATTTFDTNMRDNSISLKSVQGQFASKYFGTEQEFKEVVRRELDLVDPIETLSHLTKPYGPRRRYSRGDLIHIRSNKRSAYMFALADLNQHRTAELTTQSYMDALPVIWDNFRSKGDFGTVNCPMVGAGFSRLNFTKEMILIQIIRSFVAATREGKFLESLHIYISAKDFEDGRFSLDGIRRILDFECNYSADMELDMGRPGIDASETVI